MIISTSAAANALGYLVLTLSTTTTTIIKTHQQPPSSASPQPIPILEIVKVYGKLAGSGCYGKQAPSGSSCQIQLDKKMLLSRDEFAMKLNNDMDFQWPLKPYGIEKSLSKTAVMNKGAETRIFMDELESRRLYNPRDPTGPLPTSLRPALNKQLQKEGILDSRAIDVTYEALTDYNNNNNNNAGENRNSDSGDDFIDYYDFLKMIGTNSISWPK